MLETGQQTGCFLVVFPGSKSVKEYIKAVYCHPAYLTYTEYIMRNAGLDEAEAGIKIARRNINHLRYSDDITLMEESEELKSLLMKLKIQFSSVAQLCSTLCDPMNHSMLGLPVHHQLPESTQTHVH